MENEERMSHRERLVDVLQALVDSLEDISHYLYKIDEHQRHQVECLEAIARRLPEA